MKTTVEIEDRLLRQAKKAAVDRHTTLRKLIASGLRRELAVAVPEKRGIQRATASGPWPEGVDFSNREAMWEWLESEKREDEK